MANINTGTTTIGRTDFNTGARIWTPDTRNSGTAGDLTINQNNAIFNFSSGVLIINNSGSLSTGNQVRTGSSINITNSTIDVDGGAGATRTICPVTLTNVTILQDGGSFNWGTWNSSGTPPVYTLNDVRFWGYDLFPNFADIDPASVLNNLSFYNGDANDPLGAFLEAGQQQAYPNPVFGSTTRGRSGFSNPAALGRSIIRVNNQNNRGGGTSAGWSPYSQIDLRAIPLAGDRDTAPDGTTGTNINALSISVDRDVGLWLINPLLPDFSANGPAGAVVDNSLYWVGTSAANTDNPQTARIPTRDNPARIASYHGWNPRIQDSVTAAVVADTKIRFDDNHFTVPDTYTYASSPFEQAAGVRTAAQVTSDNGYLFENQAHNFNQETAATDRTVYNDPTASTNAEMDFTFPTRTGKLYSLTHGTGNEIGMNFSLVYPGVGQGLDQAGTTVDTITSFTAASIDWGTTSIYPLTADVYYGYGTNQTQVNNLDNIYPSIKTDYYDRAPSGFIGIGAEGSGDNTITFSRDTNIQTASSTLVQAGSLRIRSTSSLALGSRINTLAISGAANTLNLGDVTYPTGSTITATNSGEIRATADTVLSTGMRLGGEVWTDIPSASLAAGQTFITTGEYTLPSGTTDFSLTNAGFEGNSVVTLRTSGSPITITVPSTQNGTTPGFRAGTNVTLASAGVETTVTFPMVAGNFIIRNITTNINLQTGTTNTTSAVTRSFDSSQYSAISDIRVYWAADGYLDQRITPASQADFTVPTVEDPNRADGTALGSATYGVSGGVLTVTGITDAATFSASNTNLFWSRVKAQPEYVQVIAANELTAAPIRFISTTSTQINTDVIQFASGSNPARQEILTNVVRVSGTGADPIPPLSASINLQALQANIRTEGAYTSVQALSDFEAAGLATDTSLDQRLLDRENNVRASRLIPRR